MRYSFLLPRQCAREDCGTTFQPRTSNAKYCSERCMMNTYRRNRRARDSSRRIGAETFQLSSQLAASPLVEESAEARLAEPCTHFAPVDMTLSPAELYAGQPDMSAQLEQLLKQGKVNDK